MANKKRLANYYRTAYAKAKRQAKREGKTFLGRYTEPHGKKHQQRMTERQLEYERQIISIPDNGSSSTTKDSDT